MPGGAEGGHCPGLPKSAHGQGGRFRFSCLSSQERANKKQKKAAPAEEEDSGVEVYYREGEAEMEEISVLPKVRGRLLWGGEAWTPAEELGSFWHRPLSCFQ